jgi:NAD(P)-dependent dehydrogenase (short-subunit alcohol dehydrogenase family)
MASIQIDLSGKRALVTGAAMGIGEGIAHVLAEAGAHVIVVDIQVDAGRAVVGELRSRGYSAEFIELDLADCQQVTSFGSRLADSHPALEILVNNAGVALFEGVADTEPADWDALIAVDLRAPYLLTRTCLSLLEAAAGASVINIASVHSVMTVPTMMAYAAAKAGVAGMTRSMAQELGPKQIRVNTVSPGFVDTPLFRGWLDSEPDPKASLERVLGIIPIGRISTPREVGELIAFLASDLGRSISGANLMIDGGLTTRLMH